MTNSNNGGRLYQEIIRAIAGTYKWQDYEADTYESVDALIETARKIQKENPSDFRISESSLNRLGYDFLSRRNFNGAVSVFKLNAEFYFKSANVYDSLGDGYHAAGKIEEAIESYQNAIDTLDKYPVHNEQVQTLRATSARKMKELREILKQQK
jgi:tetratricopeptide (TPR) repeat protein